MKPAVDHPSGNLTGRQLDCMRLVKAGLSSKQIARELGISPRTVDDHVAAALDTLGVPSRMAAIARLYELERAEVPSKADEPFMLRIASNSDETHLIDSGAERPAAGILPPLGGAANAASRSQRIGWMIRIAVFCTMLACACILTVLGAYEIVNDSNR